MKALNKNNINMQNLSNTPAGFVEDIIEDDIDMLDYYDLAEAEATGN